MDDEEVKEGLAVLLPQAPKQVQNFILNELSAFVIELIAEYALHIDQGGVVEQELLLMLLGQESPSDFSKSLIESGIPAEDVKSILNEVNEKIFKRLQQQELAAPNPPATAYRTPAQQPVVPVMQVTAPVPVIPSIPAPAPVPVPSEPASFNLMRPDALVSAPPSDHKPDLAANVHPIAPQLVMRTMQTDMEALKHPGQSPSHQMNTMPNNLHPSQVMPARSFQTASVPYTAASMAPHPVPAESRPVSSPQLPPVQTQKPQPPATPRGNSSSDPYREPLS